MPRAKAVPSDPPQQLALLFDAPAPAAGSAGPHGASATGSPEPAPRTRAASPVPAACPSVFRHPEAAREIRLGEHLVGYALRRARRRSIGFVVGTEGLAVSAPRWVGSGDIDAALRAKQGWILRKLHEQRERAGRLAAARVDWRCGAEIPFLGQRIVLRLEPGGRGALLDADARTLRLALPQGAAPAQLRDAVQSWLQRQARRVFEERLALYAPRLGVRMKRLVLSSAATRWGSASADGSIRLNWRLVHFGLPVIDYVVAHELAHLREMNHGPAFWSAVREVMPGYEHARGVLRQAVLPVLD